MNKPKQWIEEIYQDSKDIKLPVVRQCFQEVIKEANQKDASFEEFLALLLQREWDARQELLNIIEFAEQSIHIKSTWRIYQSMNYRRMPKRNINCSKHLNLLRKEEI